MERRNLACRVAGGMLLAAALGFTAPAATAADAKTAPKPEAKNGSARDADHRAHAEDAAAAARAQALEDGWPDTPAGMVAGGWVRAFSTGEKAMRAFLEHHVSEKGLEERPMGERIESYLGLRERFGDLALHSVVESAPEELTVVLLAEDAAPHRFVFTVEKDPPHRLLRVGMIQGGHGHGHGGHRPK